MIVTSFGPAVEAAASYRSVFPTLLELDSYKAFFSFSEYSVKWLANTFVVSACQVLGNVVFASLAGYAFAKLQFKGKNFLFNLILIGMMIPYQVTQVPLYILIVNKFHLSNSYAALVLPGLVTSYNIFLTKQFFSSLPDLAAGVRENRTAAASPRSLPISCCPCPRPFWRCCPSTPSFPAGTTSSGPSWSPPKRQMYTIQVGLKQFKFANTTLFGPMMAGATISALPMFILFFCLQKYFLEGVTVGAVKG